ncbi:XrtA/PEP-CTERM system TPR-repeat protein PrsT [Rubrivivax gelatinosus]|uniref:XrtA/PEP-CTERM system TPR-repeat protein PrsT n=1 Tax=Rubrivivax gelatinosus TaxID=28068 RepID=UPI0031F9E1DF
MKIRNAFVPMRPALFALAFTAAVAAHAADMKSARFYEDALSRYEKRDYAGAVVQLKNALKTDKTQLPVHVLLGKALLANGDAVGAQVAFEEALRLGVNRAEVVLPLAQAMVGQGKPQALLEQPRFAPAGLPTELRAAMTVMRADASADTGDARSALQLLDEAKALAPRDPGPWLAEVTLRLRTGLPNEAQAAADKALALAPGLAQAHYLRGTVAHARGQFQAALDSYGRALGIDPAQVEALVSRAGLLLDLQRTADAQRDVDRLRKAAPADPRGAYLQALLAEKAGRGTESRAALRDVTGLLDPVPMEYLRYRPQLLMLGGLAHYGLGEQEKALPYLEAVQRALPGTGAAKLIAQIQLTQNNVDRAIESLETYLRRHPQDSQATLLLAAAQMAQGRHARAAAIAEEALRQGDSPQMRGLLGLSLAAGGKMPDAVQALEAAFKADPKQLPAGIALAQIRLQSGDARRAAQIVQTLLQNHPRQPGLLNLLGSAKARLGDSAGARQAFEQALALDPRFVAPQVQLARLDAAAGKPDAAQQRLQQALARDDKALEPTLEMARLSERRGRLDDARRWYEKADDVAGPNLFDAALELVDFHLRHDQPEAAREAAKRLTTRAPEAVPVLITLARVSLANDDLPAARTGLTRASTLADHDVGALVRIALLQLAANHAQGAQHTLNKALAERPDSVPVQALMVDAEIRGGDVAAADKRARSLAAQYPKLAVGQALLGDVALARGQTAAAVEAYRGAHRLQPSSESLLRLYRVLAPREPAAAQTLLEHWLATNPRDLVVRRTLADGYARAGQWPAAASAYQALLKQTPDDAEALNNLAQVQIRQKDAAALQTAERALALKPGAPHILGTAGWAAFQAGQTDKALQRLRDARLRDPGNASTRYYLATVLARSGRTAEAREEVQAALRTPSFAEAKDAQTLLQALK